MWAGFVQRPVKIINQSIEFISYGYQSAIGYRQQFSARL